MIAWTASGASFAILHRMKLGLCSSSEAPVSAELQLIQLQRKQAKVLSKYDSERLRTTRCTRRRLELPLEIVRTFQEPSPSLTTSGSAQTDSRRIEHNRIMRSGIWWALAVVLCFPSLLLFAVEGSAVKRMYTQRASPFRSQAYMLPAARRKTPQPDVEIDIVRRSLYVEGAAERGRS